MHRLLRNSALKLLLAPRSLLPHPSHSRINLPFAFSYTMGRPKRKVKSADNATPLKRRKTAGLVSTNPNKDPEVLDDAVAARASPDATDEPGALEDKTVKTEDGLEADGEHDAEAALERPPPVNSDYVPLPWKGRLGFACLNTYLRTSNPPVFSSRTCRIASILDHRHLLQNPDEPPHPTKNRPDKEKPASIERGQAFVESLGLANARDIVKMLRWNEKYGIKFMRLSSEMFPFASHDEYGYKLAPFASEALAQAGKVAAQLGHRLTTHPGQYTQLGSPRKPVIDGAIRDLDYHAELLSLLKLPPQQDRDAVMILHLGGVFGDKAATLDRFRENYAKLPAGVKKRLVLENDDVSWSVHELLPLCEELNIPMVLDFHHHNIIFDSTQIREGTKDIMELFPRILATWKRKNITPKMHYSEPTVGAITPRQRRKHSPRVENMPPCPPDMDLMIEAKDKEQAVFELMRKYKLPGYDSFQEIIPHVRRDENKPLKHLKKKVKSKDGIKAEDEEPKVDVVADKDVGMGGPEGRVYWLLGMEAWLTPVKRVIKRKEPEEDDADTKKKTGKSKPVKEEKTTKLKVNKQKKPADPVPKKKTQMSKSVNEEKLVGLENPAKAMPKKDAREASTAPKKAPAKKPAPKKRTAKPQTPSLTSDDSPSMSSPSASEDLPPLPRKKMRTASTKTVPLRRSRSGKQVNYVENDSEGN